MDVKQPGLNRYLYEYFFYRAVETSPAWTSSQREPGQELAPFTATQGRRLRLELDAVLAEKGATAGLDTKGLGVSTVFASIDEAFSRVIEDHRPIFPNAEAGKDSVPYQKMFASFGDLIGLGGREVSGGARLPVSPYDPRWSARATVLDSGVELLAVPDEAVRDGLAAGADFTALHELAGNNAFDLVSASVPEGRERPEVRGKSYGMDDISGMAMLKGYMSAKEYRVAAPWVARGGALPSGGYASDRYMTPDALARSTALLDYMDQAGVEYSIVPDRNPGQLKARLRGSGLEVRLADTRSNEAWVGRIYDGGIMTRYSPRTQGRKAEVYTPSPGEAVDLLRFALGETVQRQDGRGPVGAPGERSGEAKELQSSYHGVSDSAAMLQVGPDLFIRRDAKQRTESTTWFAGEEEARAYLEGAVSSAREHLSQRLDIEALIAESAMLDQDVDHVPALTGDEDLVALKQSYWETLRAERTGTEAPRLLTPGYSERDYEQALELGDFAALSQMVPSGSLPDGASAADRVRAHSEAVVDSMVGTLEPGADGKRFDPVRVAELMNSQYGMWRNNDDVVEALRKTDITADELRGNDFYNKTVADRMITFDESTATDMLTHSSPVLARLGAKVSEAISHQAAEPVSVLIDDKGIVRWTAERRVGQYDDRSSDRNDRKRFVTGEIGQVFDRGEFGEVVTKFGSGDDHMFVPGYEAVVVPQAAGESKSLEERTRLRGYEQLMGEAIMHNIGRDILSNRSQVGRPTSLNSTMRKLYTTRHDVDFFDRSAEEGLSPQWREAILKTEGLRVHYSNDLRNGSTAMAHGKAERAGFDPRNDNGRDPLVLTGNRNMSVLDVDAGAGYFDPMMTGMAGNQGTVRYLVPSARIDAEGFIVAGDPDDRVPVAEHSDSWAMGFDPHDRQNMTFSNVMQASSIVEGARTAMTQFGGWTFEDGIVVSQRFAEQNQIRDTSGALRPLKVGDKLSDFHGNKGVVSLIVDPQASPDAAEAAGVADEVAFFADNPELDVVMSPFSAISRFNGGTARELMRDPADLVVRERDGSTREVEAGSGSLNLIVTHMAVDAKTNVYDAEAMREGKGRKASSQLAWALQAQGCDEVFKDFYGSNTAGVANMREYLLVLGLDMSPDGDLALGQSPESPERRVFEMPELVHFAERADGRPAGVNVAAMREAFGEQIATSGGVIELPFELRLRSGEKTEPSEQTPGAYLLPLLSSHLRSEQDLNDGTVSRHDHTRRYLDVFEAAVRYRAAEESLERLLAEGGSEGGTEAVELRAKMLEQKGLAQGAYDAVAADVVARRVESKANMFKESVMSNRVSHSATAVWTGDPRLDVDQVAMNSSMAHELGADKNGYVMVWRDPVLRSGGVRYMRVSIDESLEGVAVNPVSVKSFDGDFDGDSVGLVGNLSPEAHREAMAKLSVEANLLDLGAGKRTPEGVMEYPLSLHDSLDIKVAQTADPERAEHLDEMLEQINSVHRDWVQGTISAEERVEVCRAYMEDLSDFYRDAFSEKENRVTLQFGDLNSHLSSVARCYETGAKGSLGKLKEYAEYLGAQGPDDDGIFHDRVELGALEAKPGYRREMREHYEGSQQATALKTQYTGIAGARSQSMVQLLRAQGKMQTATEIGYPAAQAMLQAKHDPKQAQYQASTLDGPARELLKGHKLLKTVGEDGKYYWEKAVDQKGKPVQASRSEWIEQFEAMYTHDQGMGVTVGIDQLESAADALCGASGTMLDTGRDNWQDWPEGKKPLVLDQLAYGGSFDDLCEAAKNKESLFTGLAQDFAPVPVRANMDKVEQMTQGVLPADSPLSYVAARDVKPVRVPGPELRAPIVESEAAVVAVDEPVTVPTATPEPDVQEPPKETVSERLARLTAREGDQARAQMEASV